jgi:hypothetical protein
MTAEGTVGAPTCLYNFQLASSACAACLCLRAALVEDSARGSGVEDGR